MFEKSYLTTILCDHLRQTNGEISYARICDVAGCDIGVARPAIASARRILEREKIVFATVRGVGLRRIDDSEIVRSTEKIKGTIRRASRRGIKRLNAVSSIANLLPSDQISATLNRTIFEAVHQHTTSPTTRKPVATPAIPDLSVLKSQFDQSSN